MAVKINGTVQSKAPAKQPAKAEKPKAETKAKKPRGKRITNKAYPDEVYDRLFQCIANGETLTDACKRPGMPSVWTVRRRMAVDDPLADRFKKAESIKYRAMIEDLPTAGARAIEGQTKVTTADRLAAAKLDSDNKKWIAQRILPEFAGDSEGGNVVFHVTGAADIPPVTQPDAPTEPAPLAPVLKLAGKQDA
jgi:hypothetical protein